MPFAATWIKLEIIILSEQERKTNTIQYHLYVESEKWYKSTYLKNRSRLISLENKFMVNKAEM